MKTISIHDAKTNLSKYIAAAKAGEKVYIGSFGNAEVVLTALPAVKAGDGKRDFSPLSHKLTAQPDAFSAATDRIVSDIMLGE